MTGQGILQLALVVVGLLAFAQPIRLYVTSVYVDVLDVLYIGPAAVFMVGTRALGEPLRSALYAYPLLYVVGGLVAGGLLVYLIVALLKPDAFS
jgi:K+-transporting ATPase KdpF subunit